VVSDRHPHQNLVVETERSHRPGINRQMPGKENPWANDAPQSRLDLNGRLENPGPNARSPVGRRLGLPEFSGSSFPRIQKAMAALRVSPSPSMMVATGDKYCNEAPGMFPWLGGYDALSLCDLLYAETQGSWGFVATDFLSRHLEITSAHRAILVNWLVEVDCDSLRWNSMGASSASQLDSPRVLSSAVRLLDQFLARTKIPVRRSNLQLIGITCYMLAAKSEFANSDLGTFGPKYAYSMCAEAFSKKEIGRMELEILATLDWQVAGPMRPLPVDFLEYFIKGTALDSDDLKLARKFDRMSFCIMEAILLSSQMAVAYKPSALAASAVLFAQRQCGLHDKWSSTLELLSGYTEHQLEAPVSAINRLVSGWSPNSRNSIQNKYSSVEHARVADLLCQAPPGEPQ